jgi:excisionase family DNA binding protein
MRIDPAHYVRVGTAAKLAGVTRAYIRRLIHEKRIKAVEVDGVFLVLRSDAESYQRRNDPRET